MSVEVNQAEKLFNLYNKTRDPKIKEKLMLFYLDFVKGIVRKMNLAYSGALLSEDDLVDIGMIGLSDAIEKFDPKVGVKFETYAYTRIRGCIIDEIRKLDNLPRSTRHKIGLLDKVRSKIENEIGDKVHSWKVADEVGISAEEYEKILKLEQGSKPISFNLNVGENIELGELIKSEDKNPEELLFENEIKQAIAEELKKLSERERLVIVLYYYEELTFKEIAGILKLSESRVSQIHSEAVSKIRNSLKSKLSF